MTAPTIVVLAGNYREFLDYCERRIAAWDRPIYLAHDRSLAGLTNIEVHRTGTWATRPDLARLETVLSFIPKIVEQT